MSTFAPHPAVANGTKPDLRVAHTGDAEFLFRLFIERNKARFAPLGWSDAQLRSMLQMQYRARVAGYAQQFADLEHFVICIADQQPVGEVLMYRTNQEMRIVDICISNEYREQEIGTQVLSELQREAAATESAITLSVDHENPARKLYERLGFHETGCNALQAEMRWQFAETV